MDRGTWRAGVTKESNMTQQLTKNNLCLKKKRLEKEREKHFKECFCVTIGFHCGSDDKESACQRRRHGFDSWVRKIPWISEWIPTPVFMPGKFYGQRTLVGYSPWYCKELDMTQRLNNSNRNSHKILGGRMSLVSYFGYLSHMEVFPMCVRRYSTLQHVEPEL